MPHFLFFPVSTSRLKLLRPAAALLLLALAGLACSLTGSATTPVSQGTGGAGSFNNLAAGLDGLSSYRATLHIDFNGSKDGAPLVWSQDLVLESDRAASARLLTMSIHGPDPSQDADGVLIGQFGSISLSRPAAGGACRAEVIDQLPTVPEPASLLRPLKQPVNFSGSPVEQNGVSALHAALDNRSVGASSTALVNGELWIAKDGRYVVHYNLEIQGKSDDWGKGIEGTMRWEYDLELVNQDLSLLPPAGCPLGMVTAPMPEDAAGIESQPGILTMTTGQDVTTAAGFYRAHLPLQGWVESEPGFLTPRAARLTFLKPGQQLVIRIQDGPPTQVWITLENPASPSPQAGAATATPGGSAENQVVDPVKRVLTSISNLLGTGTPAFSSYHLEVNHMSPVWAGGKVGQKQELLSADVQGKDVHFTDRNTDPGGSTTTAEAYLIGDQEYDVLNGQVQPPGAGLTSLAWSLWPLDPVIIITSGATGATAAGTEEVQGRTTEIYELNSTGSSQAGMSGIGPQVTSVSGKVWVDRQTGTLIKALLDYKAEVSDSGGNPQGTGSGHLEIIVTQVGKVTVSVPGQ